MGVGENTCIRLSCVNVNIVQPMTQSGKLFEFSRHGVHSVESNEYYYYSICFGDSVYL